MIQYIDILLIANHYQGIAEHIENKLLERHKDILRLHVMDPGKQCRAKTKYRSFVISTVPLEIIGKQIINISAFL